MLWSQFILLDILKTLKNTCEIVSPSKIIEDCLSINFPGYPENFPDHQKNINTIRKLSRLSGNFPDHPENIQPTRKLSRLSGNFLYHPENIQPIRKLSKGSGNFPVQFQGLRAKTFRTRKNFPDGNATMPRWFLGLCFRSKFTHKFMAEFYF